MHTQSASPAQTDSDPLARGLKIRWRQYASLLRQPRQGNATQRRPIEMRYMSYAPVRRAVPGGIQREARRPELTPRIGAGAVEQQAFLRRFIRAEQDVPVALPVSVTRSRIRWGVEDSAARCRRQRGRNVR